MRFRSFCLAVLIVMHVGAAAYHGIVRRDWGFLLDVAADRAEAAFGLRGRWVNGSSAMAKSDDRLSFERDKWQDGDAGCGRASWS